MPHIVNQEKENYYVDILDIPETETTVGFYKNVATFHSYNEAVNFATAAFGADEEGTQSKPKLSR